jgi:hypothetical protein
MTQKAKPNFRFDFECIPCGFKFWMLNPINCAPECPQCQGPTQLLSVTGSDKAPQTPT